MFDTKFENTETKKLTVLLDK